MSTAYAYPVLVSPPSSLPDQMALFDAGVDVSRLRRAREVLLKATKAANTESAYRSAWKLFSRWCLEAGRLALPAAPETVSLYVMALLEERYRLQTIRVKLSGIAAQHVAAGLQSPIDDVVRLLLSNASRVLQERPQKKAAITVEQLRRVSSLLSDSDALDARDRAIFNLGFALGWRRAELSVLDLCDLAFRVDRGVVFTLGASKTDQKGKGRVVSIPFGSHPEICPIRALEAWLSVRGRWRGPLFCRFDGRRRLMRARLSGHAICSVTQRLLRRIGEDSRLYGAHSLRAGMATAGGENSASDLAIMQRAGWKSMQTVLGYVRPAQGFRVDPLAGVL